MFSFLIIIEFFFLIQIPIQLRSINRSRMRVCSHSVTNKLNLLLFDGVDTVNTFSPVQEISQVNLGNVCIFIFSLSLSLSLSCRSLSFRQISSSTSSTTRTSCPDLHAPACNRGFSTSKTFFTGREFHINDKQIPFVRVENGLPLDGVVSKEATECGVV